MKKILIIPAMLLAATSMFAQKLTMDEAFKQADKIVSSIRKTSFPDRKFNICDFGAKSGDSTVLNHEAINNAIIACTKAGGGMVVVPKGTFYTGPITLKSNVNLHFEDGAVLKFTTDPTYYFPQVLTRWEGLDCYNMHPLIYAYGESNIAITGKGRLDGQGEKFFWSLSGKHALHLEGVPHQGQGGREKLLMYAETFAPVDRRIMKYEDALRPQFVNIYNCNGVLIEDITLTNSPFWVLHPLLSQNIIVRGVTVNGLGPNGDGCDPESCKNVLIENCVFNTGDDCIAIKSGRNADGRKWNVPSENIIVRGCKMNDGHGGVVIGSEISGGYRNLFVENCEMDSPHLDRVVRIKTSTCRGGVIENIYVRNVKVGQCGESVVRINLQYENREKCERGHIPTVRNVNIENVTCQKSKYGIQINGLDEDDNIYDINLKNCEFNGVTDKKLNLLSGKFHNVNLDNVKINGKKAKLK